MYFFFLFSQSFADTCNPQNLKINLLTEFYTCKTDQRLDYLKIIHQLGNGTRIVSVIFVLKNSAKKTNKISIKNENQLKKKMKKKKVTM